MKNKFKFISKEPLQGGLIFSDGDSHCMLILNNTSFRFQEDLHKHFKNIVTFDIFSNDFLKVIEQENEMFLVFNGEYFNHKVNYSIELNYPHGIRGVIYTISDMSEKSIVIQKIINIENRDNCLEPTDKYTMLDYLDLTDHLEVIENQNLLLLKEIRINTIILIGSLIILIGLLFFFF